MKKKFNGSLLVEVPTVGYTLVPIEQNIGKFYASENYSQKLGEIKQTLEEKAQKSVYQSSIAGAGPAIGD